MADKYTSLLQLRRNLEEGRDYRVTCWNRNNPVTILAPHGGYIEPGTSAIARGIAGDDFNLYDFQGLQRERPDELHVTSTRFRDTALTKMIKKSQLALSIHGMGQVDKWAVWIGGLNLSLKDSVVASLEDAGFRVNINPPKYRGEHAKNVVNLVPGGGVQLELPEDLIDSLFADGTLTAKAKEQSTNKRFTQFTGAIRRSILRELSGADTKIA
ncbi:MAG: poly-gamma-glutamate hydrolase family protein [Candidatus Obscuribacterales bacterium]|nr:poly-gamma-glutamate hydrolase family protein [Candidatus Obscuribacterales bacterium]